MCSETCLPIFCVIFPFDLTMMNTFYENILLVVQKLNKKNKSACSQRFIYFPIPPLQIGMPSVLVVIQIIVICLVLGVGLYACRRQQVQDSTVGAPTPSAPEDVAMTSLSPRESEDEQLRKAIAASIEEEAERKMIERALSDAEKL